MRNTLENKILFTVILPLVVGLALFSLVTLQVDRTSLLENENQKVTLVTESLMNGIENVMLSGKGEFAYKLIEQLAERGAATGGIYKLEVYNSQALEALKSNKGRVPPLDVRARVQQVLRSGQEIEYDIQDGESSITTRLKPLLNQQECQGCHNPNEKVIGVVLISTSNDDINDALRNSTIRMVSMTFVTALMVSLILRILIKRSVVSPIGSLITAMTNITEGRSVEPIQTGFKDEIGRLVDNFNSMTRNLLESQDHLKQSHEELEASNRMLVTLNQEMHHRIRNNLQTMTDLLSLELSHGETKSASESIRDSVGRVKSIAAVHELLYPTNVEATDIREIAERVVAISAQGILGREKSISTLVVGPRLLLSSKQATAVALVLNELVSNAFEHGFPGRDDKGNILIEMTRVGSDVTITVTDNGRGLPKDFHLNSSVGLGLQIASTLVVNDLGGTLKLENNGGTVSTVFFTLSS